LSFGGGYGSPPPAIPALESALGSHPCGALSSVSSAFIVEQTFWRESDKSQGFGDGVPSLATLPSLKFVRSSRLPSCQVDRRRRPVIEALVQALVVVEPKVAGDARSRLRHRRVILQVHLLVFSERHNRSTKSVVHAAALPSMLIAIWRPANSPVKLLAGKLRTLVAVEDVRPSPPQRPLQRLTQNSTSRVSDSDQLSTNRLNQSNHGRGTRNPEPSGCT